MKKLRRKVYMAAGYNTISLGTGRKEFSPKIERPGIEHYIKEAGQATLSMLGGAANVDECVVGNFMASRFNKQAHLGGFFGMIDAGLNYKPASRVEGACASGGLALLSGIRSVLAETAEVSLALGFEVQNTVKALYGADILAGAGWFPNRKSGHAFFFPGQFSDRAGAYSAKYGKEETRKAMARWFKQAVENARLCPTAQEFHNTHPDPESLGMMEPNPRGFTAHLNVFDCSKVSDGASAIGVFSEDGLAKAGIAKKDAVEVIGFGHVVRDITRDPQDSTRLITIEKAIKQALDSAGITIEQVGTVELHDCFTIAAIMSIEAMGLAPLGKGKDFVLEGHTARDGKIPMNTTGGLIGWGHPTGGTGVHQAVTIWEQLTGKAGDAQITMSPERPYGLSVNMGGDDVTVVSIVYKRGE
jgi:acetyl-CoA C-acetyltransferase